MSRIVYDINKVKEAEIAGCKSFLDERGIIKASSQEGKFFADFGRDIEDCCLFLLKTYSIDPNPEYPQIAETNLEFLAATQGKQFNLETEEKPGGILHELREGPANQEFLKRQKEEKNWPVTVSEGNLRLLIYEANDTTSLYLMVIGLYERIFGQNQFIQKLLPSVEAAAIWHLEYGDVDGDGLIEFEKKSPKGGLENQNWKDSGDSLLYADGKKVTGQRNYVEVQGFAYSGMLEAARLLQRQNPKLAADLVKRAQTLKTNFNKLFWLPEKQFFAQALDCDKKPVEELTIDQGLLLLTDVIDDKQKMDAVVAKLFSDELFARRNGTGWGIFSRSIKSPNFNHRYHDEIWPSINGLIVAGLDEKGYKKEAEKLAQANLASTSFFGTPIEVFSIENGTPVAYKFKLDGKTVDMGNFWQAWTQFARLYLITRFPNLIHSTKPFAPMLT